RHSSLEIPDLTFDDTFSLDLAHYHSPDPSPSFIDGVSLKHRIKLIKNRKKAFKVILLGSAAVGKTTLINSFLKKEQVQDYRPTLGISISTQKYYIQGFKDDVISFLIFDLAGQEFFKRVRHEYYKGANCAFVVYDITRENTFDEALNFWYKDIKKELGDIPIILIGNKIDLEAQRVITKEQGREKAEELSTFFIETSALHNINVQDTFKLIGIGLFFQNVYE
ncbi:MAG: GTP-binding protein, partial [Candidatus Lokiarchaeota archaeon]|nr:GTP-binding protein [Candidatus Lokiarchaeota archaeon]MBD3341268.1 GTP-binding protein [Candidatus Lokiarchaeota archaeon]